MEQNYKIVIITNQAGIKLLGINNFKKLIDDLINALEIDISVYV